MMSPAYALNIEQPTMYSVKILPGNGWILTNNEESIKNFFTIPIISIYSTILFMQALLISKRLKILKPRSASMKPLKTE